MKLSFYPSAKRLHLDKECKQHFTDKHLHSDHSKGFHLAVYQSRTNPHKIALAYDRDTSIYTAGTDIFWLLGRPYNGQAMHFEAVPDGDALTFELPPSVTLATSMGGRIDHKRKRIRVSITPEEIRAAAAAVVDHEDTEPDDDDEDDDWEIDW